MEQLPKDIKKEDESPEAQLADLRVRLRFITEPRGAYELAWQRYAIGGGGVEFTAAMADIEGLLNRANDLSMPDAAQQAGWADRVAAAVAMANDLPRWLSVVDAELRQIEGGGPAHGHALSVLDALATGVDQGEWARAAKATKAARGKGWVIGSAEVISRITALVKEYQRAWDAMATDGLKGADYAPMQKMEALRMAIVSEVRDSGDLYLHTCCAPGTKFYEYIAALARQNCSSRDVQNFAGWWAKNARSN